MFHHQLSSPLHPNFRNDLCISNILCVFATALACGCHRCRPAATSINMAAAAAAPEEEEAQDSGSDVWSAPACGWFQHSPQKATLRTSSTCARRPSRPSRSSSDAIVALVTACCNGKKPGGVASRHVQPRKLEPLGRCFRLYQVYRLYSSLAGSQKRETLQESVLLCALLEGDVMCSCICKEKRRDHRGFGERADFA